MTVTNTAQALGSWSIKLKPGTPQDIRDRLTYLGHVAVSVGRPDPRISGDSLLRSARYVGVLTKVTSADDGYALSGPGMAYWLGDANKKGPVITDQLLFSSANFTSVMTQVLSKSFSVRPGQIYPVSGAYTGYHQYVTCREVVDFVCSTMTSDTTDPVEWRVNGDGTVDAGTASQLYVHNNPVATIGRKLNGVDLHVRALPGQASVDEDIEDFSTEVILLGQGEGLGIASAQVKLPDAQIPYKDLFGNTVRIARTVSQSSTDAANSLVQAQIALDQYSSPRDAVTLSTDEFDIEGVVGVGDSIWVLDPDSGLIDTSPSPNEIIFQGERINPVRLRVSELTWPVEQGMSAAYRGPDGHWIDLTDYLVFESGSTSVTVGGYDRSLTNPTGRQEALGSRAAPNTSIPATPQFVQPFTQAVYQSSATGISKAQIQLHWLRPLNTDGTDVIDGDHYEVRYRTSDGPLSHAPADSGDPEPVYPGTGVFPGSGTYPGSALVGGSAAVIPPGSPTTWAQAAGLTWAQMGTWAQPIEYVAGPWLTSYAAFDASSLLLQELTPGVAYQFSIRAVDNGVPPNYSDWSDPVEIVLAGDTIPPPTPAPAEVASSLIAVQITHLLGAASGGTFNLPADLHHLEVHGAYEPTFTCSPATLLGKVSANNGMIVSQTPVVATLQVETTADIYIKIVAVDEAGNRSTPSAPTQSTAALIDNEHISNLSVSKILAGEITADWIQTASLSTAPPGGARAGLDAAGLFAYNAQNKRVWEVQDLGGDMVFYSPAGVPTMRFEAATGNVYLYQVDGHSPAMRLTASSGQLEMSGKLNAGAGVGSGATIVVDPNGSDSSPHIDIYPNSSGEHFDIFAYDTNVPDGSTGGALGIRRINASGQRSGPYYQAWNAGHFFATMDAATQKFFGAFLDMRGHADGSQFDLGCFGAAGAPSDGTLNTSGGTSMQFTETDINIDAPGNLNVAVVNSPTALLMDATVASLSANDLYLGSGNTYIEITTTAINVVKNGTAINLKSFVIDHPTDPDRWLVHVCTESPTAGVEYTGEVLVDAAAAVVELPPYFEALTETAGRTVQLTPVDELCMVAASGIVNGRFTVRCSATTPTRVAWHVRATRRNATFNAEPLRADVNVHGDGPYRYLTPRPTAVKDAA